MLLLLLLLIVASQTAVLAWGGSLVEALLSVH